MSIRIEDIKLMASQRLTDTDDGGGDMTGHEVVSGELNNLFPDISRWDRAYGRVSLREAFVSVQTQNTDTYSGSHVILSAPAKDPSVNVCLFKTGNPYDLRNAARDYIERYVVRGSRFSGWLWGLHPAGSRSLLIFAVKGTRAPSTGSVLYLSGGNGQYVRITKVSVTRFDDMLSSGASASYYSRDIFEIAIADPLSEDQPGLEISASNSQATSIYTTVVNNSAKYYGVMLPTKAIAKGDVAINVDSIYTRLVPSAQAETPLADLSVGEINPVIESGVPVTLNLGVVSASSGALLHLNRGIAPASLTLSTGARTFTDKGDGLIYEGETQRGTIDYASGQITWGTLGQNFNANINATCVIATAVNQVANTHAHPITLASQSNSYTMILEPPPSPGTLRVDYMAQGQWYRLRDKGLGLLEADIEGTGTGKLNYQSGQVILTCGALPDVGSQILYAWSAPLEMQDASGEVEIGNAQLQHQCADAPIKPGTVEIVWQTINGEASLVDNGLGTLTGNGTGRVNYALGRLFWQPDLLVSEGGYTLRYHTCGRINEAIGAQMAGGVGLFRLNGAPVRPGSVSMGLSVYFSDGSSHIYEFTDDGQGRLSAPGGGTEGLGEAQGGQPQVAYSYGDASASVDYTNGVITVSLAALTGTRTDYLYEYVKKHSDATGWYWIQRYKGAEATALSATGMGGTAACGYSLTNEATEAAEEEVAAIPYTVDLLPHVYGRAIVPGSVDFTWGQTRYIDRMGKLYRNPQAATGQGAEAGEIDYSSGICRISSPDSAATSITVRSMLTRFGRQMLINAAFRTPGAPLRPAALQIQAVAADGRLVTALAAADGSIDGTLCRGEVDYETGIVDLQFGEMVTAAGNENEAWYDAENVIDGRIWKPLQVYGDQLVYACVVYSSIPLDAELIGINPARLPVDGRVPIVRSGDVVVIHHSTQTQLPLPLAAGSQINLGNSGISHVDLVDADGAFVSSALFSLADGVLTMADDLAELANHQQPLTALARIEDMRLVSQVQINGQVVLTSGVDHSYPVQGTYVSTALPFGDLSSRAYGIFDQKTWGNVWSDSLIGDPAPAGYNEIDYPPVVYNKGAVTERWALVFDSPEHFKIHGERRGVVAEGYISQDCQPLNNATGQPYFLLDRRGWGTGWATGNALRFNTEGANGALWVARTTLQGPVAEANDRFTLQIRGDAQ